MNYTTNYHLPQWVKTDRIMMDDFNQMCQDIDAGLTTAVETADGARDTANAAQQTASAAQQTANAAYSPNQKPYAVGTYLGTKSTDVTVTLGFQPSVVLIFAAQYGNDTGGVVGQFSAAGQTIHSAKIQFTETGFVVKGETDDTPRYPQVNLKYATFEYIAFR